MDHPEMLDNISAVLPHISENDIIEQIELMEDFGLFFYLPDLWIEGYIVSYLNGGCTNYKGELYKQVNFPSLKTQERVI